MPIQKFELPNGLRLLVKEDHRLPFVEFRAMFQGGVLAETKEDNGITQLSSRMLLKGTSHRSAREIATEIESVGGSIDSYGGNNSFGVNVEILSSDFATGLDLLADVLLNPVFPADALEREREVQIADIYAQKDNLLKSASLAMRRALFGNSGYGLDSTGQEETVAKLKAASLKSFHKKLAMPNNCVLAIYGDVETAEVKAAVEKAFGHWKPGRAAKELIHIPAGMPVALVQRVEETRDKKQAVVVVGFPGTTLHDEDHFRAGIDPGIVQRPRVAAVFENSRAAGPRLLRRRATFCRPGSRLFRLLRRHRTGQSGPGGTGNPQGSRAVAHRGPVLPRNSNAPRPKSSARKKSPGRKSATSPPRPRSTNSTAWATSARNWTMRNTKP